MGDLRRVVDDAAAELRVRHRREREDSGENGKRDLLNFHDVLPSCAVSVAGVWRNQKSLGIVWFSYAGRSMSWVM